MMKCEEKTFASPPKNSARKGKNKIRQATANHFASQGNAKKNNNNLTGKGKKII